jgi:hypothetical protein
LATDASTRTTLWASDSVAELIEELQFSLGEGACVDAARTGDPVLVPDLDHSTFTGRWPVFAVELTARTHVGALFGFPLRWDTLTIGALDLYRRASGTLSQAQLSDVEMAAQVAAMLVVDILSHTEEHDTMEGLPAKGREEVSAAVGILMARLRASAPDALARLRGYAFTAQRPMGAVAHGTVSGALDLPTDSG